MDSNNLSPQGVWSVLKQRFWAFVLPVAGLMVVAAVVIFLLPPVYRSTATILIENQDIPRDLVRSTVNTFANERLEIITRRVTTTAKLVALVNRRKLYAHLRGKETLAVLARRVRQNFNLQVIEANVIDGRSGQAKKATIAFNLSFEHSNPVTAQAVVNDFSSLYISENLRTRREKSEETAKFLRQEVEKSANQISALEANLARFKQTNAGLLPEQMELVANQLGRIEGELVAITSRIRMLGGRSNALKAELREMERNRSQAGGSDRAYVSLTGRLGAARGKLARLRGRYGDRHPDVVRLRRQIAALASQVQRAARRQARTEKETQELQKTKRLLAAAMGKYKTGHPELTRLKERVAKLERSVRRAPVTGNGARGANDANLAIIKLKAELSATETELKTLASQSKFQRQRIKNLERRVSQAPQIEREYLLLKRGMANAIENYRELTKKLREARLGEVLELSRKAERFLLIEPANLAEKPVRPNRPAYLGVAFVIALAFGGGLVFLLESLDQTVRGPRQLAAIMGSAPLVVIPALVSPAAQTRRRKKQLAFSGSVFAVLVLGLVGGYLSSSNPIGSLRSIIAKIERSVGG